MQGAALRVGQIIPVVVSNQVDNRSLRARLSARQEQAGPSRPVLGEDSYTYIVPGTVWRQPNVDHVGS